MPIGFKRAHQPIEYTMATLHGIDAPSPLPVEAVRVRCVVAVQCVQAVSNRSSAILVLVPVAERLAHAHGLAGGEKVGVIPAPAFVSLQEPHVQRGLGMACFEA